MSIKLTRLVYNIVNLSSTEKHILKSFAWRADEQNEAWSSIERLQIDTGLTKRTIEPALKKLRDKNILKYTGKFKGKFGNVPVYYVNIDCGNFCREKDLITAIYVFDTGNFCIEMTEKIAVQKDNIKNNRKDNGASRKFSSTPNPKSKTKKPTQADLQEYAANVEGYEWVGEWLKQRQTDAPH